jgi:hypothetical protein
MISYSQRAIHRDTDRHENQTALLNALDDHDQSGLETAAHDNERTELRSTTETLQIPWPKRLEELARRTCTSSPSCLDEESAQSIHHHLDALERLLGDSLQGTMQEPMQEIVRSRSQSQNELSASVASDIITQAEESIPPAPDQNHGINKEELLSQLQGLMSEVTALNEEVNKRRKESSEIRDLFEERCRGLTRSVAELEDEVLEL